MLTEEEARVRGRLVLYVVWGRRRRARLGGWVPEAGCLGRLLTQSPFRRFAGWLSALLGGWNGINATRKGSGMFYTSLVIFSSLSLSFFSVFSSSYFPVPSLSLLTLFPFTLFTLHAHILISPRHYAVIARDTGRYASLLTNPCATPQPHLG
jgi:hypothetical protein